MSGGDRTRVCLRFLDLQEHHHPPMPDGRLIVGCEACAMLEPQTATFFVSSPCDGEVPGAQESGAVTVNASREGVRDPVPGTSPNGPLLHWLGDAALVFALIIVVLALLFMFAGSFVR